MTLKNMSTSKRQFVFICVFCAMGFIPRTSSLSRPSTMVLENNGYKNVVVAIHESVTEDKSLIDTLKDEMTKASKILHTATKQRAYFKEIKILLPSTWSSDASYQTPTTENLAFADVIITDPIRGKRSVPQARSYDGCGKQGVHVLLTKEFLTTPRIDPYLANPAKYFIHAFAQFRWGVFQEYAEEGENVFYMSPSTGQPEAIRCTLLIRGLVVKNDSAHTICYSKFLAERQHVVASVDEKTGLYHADCQWRPYPSHQRTKASIMDHQFIAEVVTFCGDDPQDYATIHNYEAPSRHNRMCGHRSTWDVITETDDFKGGINPARSMSDDQLKPTFIVMRAKSRKRRSAVLIDPSLYEEMSEAVKIHLTLDHLQQESTYLGTEVNLLETKVDEDYKASATNGKNTVEVPGSNHSQKRAKFADQVKETIDKYTDSGEDKNVHLVVLTNNVTEDIVHVLNDGDHALEVTVITNHTANAINDHQGRYAVHVAGDTLGHTVLDRLRYTLLIDHTQTIVVAQEELLLLDSRPVTGYVDIDSTLGGHLTFTFHFEEDIHDINLRSPSGNVYNTEANICSMDTKAKVVLFHIEEFEVGSWNYTVWQSSNKRQKVHVTVISKETKSNEDPVVIRQSVKFADKRNNSVLLHVDITQGLLPLMGLNVTARIELPNGSVAFVRLLDNGAGADVLKNDGVYSRIYLAPKITGLYHVTFDVSGKAGHVFRKQESDIDVHNINKMKKTVTKQPIEENIQRQISGGTIQIDHTVNHDVIAPSRITDLEVLRYIPYRKTVVLRWTAAGDDHDHGTPASYQLFVGYGVRDIRLFLQYFSTCIYEGQGHVTKETIPARARGTEDEILLWNIKTDSKQESNNVILVFAVRAVDEYGNIGDISNIATTAASI